jgi:hypothetical protein
MSLENPFFVDGEQIALVAAYHAIDSKSGKDG